MVSSLRKVKIRSLRFGIVVRTLEDAERSFGFVVGTFEDTDRRFGFAVGISAVGGRNSVPVTPNAMAVVDRSRNVLRSMMSARRSYRKVSGREPAMWITARCRAKVRRGCAALITARCRAKVRRGCAVLITARCRTTIPRHCLRLRDGIRMSGRIPRETTKNRSANVIRRDRPAPVRRIPPALRDVPALATHRVPPRAETSVQPPRSVFRRHFAMCPH
jgi:hypothetical protein